MELCTIGTNKRSLSLVKVLQHVVCMTCNQPLVCTGYFVNDYIMFQRKFSVHGWYHITVRCAYAEFILLYKRLSLVAWLFLQNEIR